MPRPRKYSDELRERAVRLVFESGRPIAHVAADLGIHKESLRGWFLRRRPLSVGELFVHEQLAEAQTVTVTGLRPFFPESSPDRRWGAPSRDSAGPVSRGQLGTIWIMSRLERITSDPAICHGQPAVRGLRYTVEMLLELLSAGMTFEEVLGDYPDLERDDLLAALEFGALAAGRGRVVPLSTA